MIQQTKGRVINRIGKPIGQHWSQTVATIKASVDIKSSICVGCGKGAVYDKNNVRYMVSWQTKPEELQALLKKIRDINDSNNP